METFIYDLNKELQFSKGGDFSTTASLEFTSAGMSAFDEVSEFEQLIAGAFLSSAKAATTSGQAPEEAKADEQVSPSASDIKMILVSCQDIKLADIAKSFRRLACKTCTIDNSGTLIKDSHFNKLSREDFMGMLCEYVANFTFPSLF